MSEMYPEYISSGELADMVRMGSLDREPALAQSKIQDMYGAAWLALTAAENRRDERAIDDAEERLRSMVQSHPELRQDQ
jgi:hypothetical protein